MKTQAPIFGILYKLILIMLAVALVSCTSNQKEQKLSNSFETEKEELVSRYKQMKNDIDQSVKELEAEIAKSEGEVVYELRAASARLKAARRDIDKSIQEVQSATQRDWESIKKESGEFFDELAGYLSQLKKEADAIF